jgi:hypothetical protein
VSPAIASELFRLDPLGVLVAEDHHFARLPGVLVAALKGETLMLADEERAPEFNEFVADRLGADRADPLLERVHPHVVALDRAPRQVQPGGPVGDRPDAVLPLVPRDEVAARVPARPGRRVVRVTVRAAGRSIGVPSQHERALY